MVKGRPTSLLAKAATQAKQEHPPHIEFRTTPKQPPPRLGLRAALCGFQGLTFSCSSTVRRVLGGCACMQPRLSTECELRTANVRSALPVGSRSPQKQPLLF